MKQFNNEAMTTPNHLAGGTVFTGFFASLLFGINILASPATLITTLVASVLPDCDHTRSPIGKLLFPLAKWLNRRFGHRTITHSIPALIILTLLVSFVEKTYFGHFRVSVAFCLAYWSHLLFDMCTLQGVPLMYPFKKNPFVLIGNPDARIRVGDYRREAIAFSVFLVWGASLHSLGLLENGFWTTYNRTFSTLPHLHSEFRRSTDLLQVDYVYKEGTVEHSGTGYLIESTQSKATLLTPSLGGGRGEAGRVGEWSWLLLGDAKMTVKKVYPTHTGKPLDIRHLDLVNVSADSLNRALSGKTILSLELQANQSFQVTKDNGFPKTVSSYDGKYLDNAPHFSPSFSLPKATSDSLLTDLTHLPQIELLQQKIAIHRREQAAARAAWDATQSQIAQLHRQYAATDDPLQRQNLHAQIRELETINPPKPDNTQVEELQNQIRKIEKEAALRSEAKRQALELKRRQETGQLQELRFTGIVRYVILSSPEGNLSFPSGI
jgi:inner membrane protein